MFGKNARRLRVLIPNISASARMGKRYFAKRRRTAPHGAGAREGHGTPGFDALSSRGGWRGKVVVLGEALSVQPDQPVAEDKSENENRQNLDRCNQQVLKTMALESSPTCSFEVMSCCIGKTSFTQVPPSSTVQACGPACRLFSSQINQFLIDIAVDRTAALRAGALSPQGTTDTIGLLCFIDRVLSPLMQFESVSRRPVRTGITKRQTGRANRCCRVEGNQ